MSHLKRGTILLCFLSLACVRGRRGSARHHPRHESIARLLFRIARGLDEAGNAAVRFQFLICIELGEQLIEVRHSTKPGTNPFLAHSASSHDLHDFRHGDRVGNVALDLPRVMPLRHMRDFVRKERRNQIRLLLHHPGIHDDSPSGNRHEVFGGVRGESQPEPVRLVRRQGRHQTIEDTCHARIVSGPPAGRDIAVRQQRNLRGHRLADHFFDLDRQPGRGSRQRLEFLSQLSLVGLNALEVQLGEVQRDCRDRARREVDGKNRGHRQRACWLEHGVAEPVGHDRRDVRSSGNRALRRRARRNVRWQLR